MLKEGLIHEVQALRAQGYGHWAPMESVGYKQVQAFLDGHLPEAQLTRGHGHSHHETDKKTADLV